MSMSFTSLPPELLDRVVANIASKPNLCNLARCSRQLYYCTIPHLYRHVTIREEVRKGEQQKEELKNLAASLIRRPDLAELVGGFTLRVVRMKRAKNSDELDEESYDPAFVTAFEDSSLSKDEKVKFLGQFSHAHRSHHDIILAVLLPALLKLEKLVLDLKISSDTY